MENKDPLHPSDRCWIDYHVRIGMTKEQAALALATYRSMVKLIMGREPEADISDVLASVEQKLVEARQFLSQKQQRPPVSAVRACDYCGRYSCLCGEKN